MAAINVASLRKDAYNTIARDGEGRVPIAMCYTAIQLSEVMEMPGTTVASQARQTQMNTRIDPALKEAGDAVLARLGYSPSAAVRGLWRFVVDHQDDAAAVREVLEPNASAGLSDEVARKTAAIASLRSQYAQTAGELGISNKTEADLPSWDDLREGWYGERLEGEA